MGRSVQRVGRPSDSYAGSDRPVSVDLTMSGINRSLLEDVYRNRANAIWNRLQFK